MAGLPKYPSPKSASTVSFYTEDEMAGGSIDRRDFLIHSITAAGSVAVAACTPLGGERKAAVSGPLDGLDSYVRKGMDEWLVPGLAIAVVKDDAMVFAKGYGVREVGKTPKVDEQTIFALLSITKSFTAAAIGILVDEGKLSWDDPVVKHLSEFQLPDPWVTQEATLRDLLCHRIAGDLGANAWAFEQTSLDFPEIIRRVRYLQPATPRFRGAYQYENLTYWIAGEAVAAASGMSWGDFVTTRILQPLGMASASTKVEDCWASKDLLPCGWCELPGRTIGIEDARVGNIVMGHLPSENGPRPNPWNGGSGAYGSAGALHASVEDVAKWLRFQLGRGTHDGVRLLSPEVLGEMHSPQVLVSTQGPWDEVFDRQFHTYGLGWEVVGYRGRNLIYHGGGDPGQMQWVGMLPEENLGVAVLSNKGSGARNLLPHSVMLWVFDAYLGGSRRDWSAESLLVSKAREEREPARRQEVEAARVPDTMPSLPPTSYVGTYTHRAFGEVNISLESRSLVLRFPGGAVGGLEHWHHDEYRVRWGPGPKSPLNFVLDRGGRVS